MNAGAPNLGAGPLQPLDQALGGQAVVVEAHRVEDVGRSCARSGPEVGVAVGVDVPQVQVPDTVGGGVSIE
jgi:hypothetical protein